jgi:hypothetical protein
MMIAAAKFSGNLSVDPETTRFVCETMERSKRRRLNPKDISDEEEEFEYVLF